MMSEDNLGSQTECPNQQKKKNQSPQTPQHQIPGTQVGESFGGVEGWWKGGRFLGMFGGTGGRLREGNGLEAPDNAATRLAGISRPTTTQNKPSSNPTHAGKGAARRNEHLGNLAQTSWMLSGLSTL